MGLVVTVDGSWEIPDSFLVIWYNNEMRRIWDTRYVILQDHVNKYIELAYFCEKWTVSEHCNNKPRSPLLCQTLSLYCKVVQLDIM